MVDEKQPKEPMETNVLKLLEAHPDEAQEWYNQLPAELHEIVKQAKKRLKDDRDLIWSVSANQEGCITGDTLIRTNRNKLGRRYRIDYMYKQFHDRDHLEVQGAKQWNLESPTFVRSYNGKEIRLHKIKDVLYSGKKEVYEMKLQNDFSIKATANHKIMTQRGWVQLNKLKPNIDSVMCDTPRATKVQKFRHKFHDVQLGRLFHHPYSLGGKKRIEVHRLIYEAYINKVPLTEYIETLMNDEKNSAKYKFIDPNIWVVHHKDGNHYNNNQDNLEKMTRAYHGSHHADDAYLHFNQGSPKYSKIISIEYKGIQDTYDISCEEPYHNFAANEIIIHNSGKSTLAITVGFLLNPGEFDLKTHVAYIADTSQIKEKFYKMSVHNQLLIDEGIKSLHKHDWANAEQRKLSTMLITERWQTKAVCIAIPRIQDLPESVRNHKVLMNAIIMQRGSVVFHRRDDQNNDPWWLDWADKWKKKKWASKHVAEISFADRMKFEKIKPTFITSFEFPALPKCVEKVYLKLKSEAHMRENSDDEQSLLQTKAEIFWKEKLFKVLQELKTMNPKMTKKKMREVIDVSPVTLVKFLKEFDPKDDLFRVIPTQELVDTGVLPKFVIDEKEETPINDVNNQ